MTKPNRIHASILRPLPGKIDEFMPLWNARLKVEEDMSATGLSVAEKEILQLEHERLSREMRPFQYEKARAIGENLVTNLGRNHILDTFWRGSAYTQTVRMGLKGAGAAAAGDTQASHASWLEVGLANAPTYSGNRKDVTMGAASSQSSVSPQQSYSITSTGTVAGMFMNNAGSVTKDDTTGTLVSAADFTGGNEAVDNLDTLLVTYTFNG